MTEIPIPDDAQDRASEPERKPTGAAASSKHRDSKKRTQHANTQDESTGSQAKRYPFLPAFPASTSVTLATTLTATLPSTSSSAPSSVILATGPRSLLPESEKRHESSNSFTAACSSPCYYPATAFLKVMENLLRNPNVTSSHLFRADICWDSGKDDSFEPSAWSASSQDLSHGYLQERPRLSRFVEAMRSELRPRRVIVPGFDLTRCVVRELVPRNTQRDRKMAQTCAFFRRRDLKTQRGPSVDTSAAASDTCVNEERGLDGATNNQSEGELEETLVLYVPHVDSEDELPFYHPKVRSLAFLHSCKPETCASSSAIESSTVKTNIDHNNSESDVATIVDMDSAPGQMSLHILPFSPAEPPPPTDSSERSSSDSANRLQRTLLNLLSTMHSHGHGTLTGYTKRVHHDQLIPQPVLQDTYTRLKNKYAPSLLNTYWQEKTDARKGVFEDLGIASFLIGLWDTMYDVRQCISLEVDKEHLIDESNLPSERPPFPGFVDIGCGNGVLTFILISEGYPGYGFDIRSRKTWDAFPATVRACLQEKALLPNVLFSHSEGVHAIPAQITAPKPSRMPATPREDNDTVPDYVHLDVQSGSFPPGTFIVSNHADELTPWTPLLAHLSRCPFIAIPCCSHSLSGAKWRAPMPSKKKMTKTSNKCPSAENHGSAGMEAVPEEKGGKTGSLAQPASTRATSAYASLCAYVERLAEEVGFVPETEALRIPSTRNHAIVGRFVWYKRDISKVSAKLDGDIAAEDDDDDAAEGGDGAADAFHTVSILDKVTHDDHEERTALVQAIVERELSRSVASVAMEWVQKVEALAASKGRNH